MQFVKPNPAEYVDMNDKRQGSNGRDSFVLAHLSDPHLSELSGVRLRDLTNKRILGYISWLSKRRHIHSPLVLDELLRDLKEAAPDHVALTGDLTHLGLPDEFRQAASWLKLLGEPDRVTVIPGNHDSYHSSPYHETYGAWAPYLAGDRQQAGEYPSLRVRGPLALIGLSSSHPSPPFFAIGSLGARQLERLESVLEMACQQGLLRVVLIHHPPVPDSISWRRRLTDAHSLVEALARQGADLVLHGHAHETMESEMMAGNWRIPVIGVPSASSTSSNPQRAARYNIYRFKREPHGWALELRVRAYSHFEKRFIAGDEKEINLASLIPEKPRSAA
jgi:3',5'-cyclic AMP phosphodiesterase CpdA